MSSSSIPQIPPDVAASVEPDFDGWWATFFSSLISNLPSVIEGSKGASASFIAELAATVVELSIEITSEVGKRVGEAVTEFEQTAGPEIERAAAEALSDYFNTTISPGQISRGRSPGQREGFAQNLGSFVLEQMFGAFEVPQQITPAVGRVNAERILGYNLGTTLESWLGKVVSTTPLTRWIPNWADLDTVMQSTLGLGRINRRIMGPLLKTLVADPFQWDINKRFTPTIFNAGQLVRLLNRKEISSGDYFESMSWLGYSQTKATQLRTVVSRLPEKEDVAKLLELGAITPDGVRELFEGLGYSTSGAEMMLLLTENDRLRSINNAAESLARDMFRDREIDEAELKATLRSAGRTDAEIEALLGVAQIERSRPRSLGRGTIEEGFRKGLISLGRLREYYETEGYNLEDSFLLEELAVEDRFAFEEKQAAALEKAKTSEFRTLPKGQIERAFIEGVIPRGRLVEYYTARAFSAADQGVLLELATKRKTAFDLKRAEELERAKDPGFRKLPRGTIEAAFIRGIVNEGRLRDWYVANKFVPEEIPVLLGVVREKKAERVERLEDELERARGPDFKELPRSVMEQAFIANLVDETRLRNWYEIRGFRAAEIPILLELVRDRKEAAAAKLAAAATTPTA